MEAMICGMTLKERRNPALLNAKRRIRVAKGSGVTVTELNTMMNKFGQMQQMMKKMGKIPEDDGQNGRRLAGNVGTAINRFALPILLLRRLDFPGSVLNYASRQDCNHNLQ